MNKYPLFKVSKLKNCFIPHISSTSYYTQLSFDITHHPHLSIMLNCIICVAQNIFQLYNNISASTYLLIGIIIWLVKVVISSFLVLPRTTRYLDAMSILILLVFFSPNILFWPINIILDIYLLSMLIMKEYTTSQIIHVAVGF